MRCIYGLLLIALALQAAEFDVASIKPSTADPGSSGIDTDNGLLRAHNVTLKRCITGAYGVPESRIIGGPKWMDELRYEIVAKADHPAGDDELSSILQTLLADRFKLSLHHETQTISGYMLTVAKSGLKANPSPPDAASSTNSSRGRIDAKGCPMSRLVLKLSAALGVPVVDMTEDTRKFDFTLQWIPDNMQTKAGAAGDVPQGPSLFTALQEQLGLRLESRKMPIDVLVIDHAELPSEN
jgi:uncharacterized protein (TIGR03435 family)